MNGLEKAIEVAGGVSALAKKLGYAQSRVSNWRLRGIPDEACPAVEAATAIRCEDLRPDLDWTRDDAGQVTGYHVRIAA